MPKRLAIAAVAASVLCLGSPVLGQGFDQESVILGGRVEIPSAGYALTAPDDWVTVLPSADDAEAIIENLNQIDPDLAATVESGLAGGISFSLLIFGALDEDSGFRENCNVIDYPSDGMSLDVALAGDSAVLADMGEGLASGPEAAMLELPAGQVARLDYGLQHATFQTIHAAYYFTDGTTFHLLTCTDLQRADDDWLSIAQTFEFLDAEQ